MVISPCFFGRVVRETSRPLVVSNWKVFELAVNVSLVSGQNGWISEDRSSSSTLRTAKSRHSRLIARHGRQRQRELVGSSFARCPGANLKGVK